MKRYRPGTARKIVRWYDQKVTAQVPNPDTGVTVTILEGRVEFEDGERGMVEACYRDPKVSTGGDELQNNAEYVIEIEED